MNRLSPLLLAGCFIISACSYFEGEPEAKPLPGERISILDLQEDLAPRATDKAANIIIPPVVTNEDWPQSGGYPHHAMQNVALGGDQALEQIWRADIGTGGSDSIPLNAQPIVAAGQVFTLDARSEVRAFHNQTGKLLWKQSVKSTSEKDPVISGGLAFAGGVLFATSGYNEVLALNPANGEIYWRTKLNAGSRAAPTIKNGRVFVTTMGNDTIALDAASGKTLWEYEGVGETTGLLGAASPAANDEMIISAFSTGDIVALNITNGSVAWEDSLANSLRLGGMAGLSDIRGLPVIAGDRVIAVSFGNKMAAFDKNTGGRLWQREVSSTETPWVAGNVVYVLTPEFKVLALDVTNGDIVWVSHLAKFENEKSRKGLINWTGPIMANGRLIIAGTGGRVVELDAQSGQETNRWSAKDTISIAPIVAGGTLYMITDNGTLTAYR